MHVQVPGLGLRLDTTKLDLQYHSAYNQKELPDAYERLLLDVINGGCQRGMRSLGSLCSGLRSSL